MKASAWGCVLRHVTKRGGRVGLFLLILGGLARPAEADLYSHLQSPDSGVSHALGTPIRVDFEANYQLGWGGNVTPYVGFGKATGDSGWTWVTGSYESGGDFGADSQWYGTMTPSATGTWYFAGKLVSPPGTWDKTYYADGDWRKAEDATLYASRTITITNLPEPYECFVTNNAGPESLTLGWTPRTYYVMVVRRLGDWPDVPANGTSFTNRQTYGTDNRNFVVYAPGNGSSAVDRELTANTASNYYYAFYSENYSHYALLTGAVYSGRTMATNTPAFRSGETVDSFAYFTPRGVSSDLQKGTNWNGAWTWQNGTVDLASGSLATPVNYPAAWGGKFHAGPDVTFWHGARRQLRTPYTSGSFYLAFVYRPGAVGANKWSGISIYDGLTEKAFVGAPGGLTVASIEKTGGGQAQSGYTLSTSGDNTIIARYDFASHTLSLVAYYQTDIVPVAEPSSWGASLDLGAGHLTSIDQIAFNAGGWDGGNVGDVYWDEVRVASSWSDLLGKLATAPTPNVITINGGADVTDAQVASGSFPVVMHLYDQYGVNTSGGSPLFPPNYDLFNTTGTQVLGDEVFNSFIYTDSGRTLIASDTTHGAVSAGLIELGTYTARVSAVNSNYATTIDRPTLSNGTAMTFTVIDDDTTGPILSGFGVAGVALEGASFNTAALGAGLAVTGQTRDAQSGVFAGTSNTYVLTRDGSLVQSGSLTAGFSDGTALASAGSLTVTLTGANVQPVGVYTLTVASVNYDLDRATGDPETSSAAYSFSVVPPGAGPGLGRGPAALTVSTMLGTPTPITATFSVTNEGGGTLAYTNSVSYGSGAGWLSVAEVTGSLDTGLFQQHTATVSAAGVAVGSYNATITIDGNQTNGAQTVAVTLSVTNVPAPTATAAADGAEMVRLTWDSALTNVLIVYRAGSAPSANPVNGVAYQVGDTIGGGTVIRKTSSAGSRAFEHTGLAQGTTHYYVFYAANHSYYSPALTRTAATTSYKSFETVDPVPHTNGVDLAGLGGGIGWTNGWTVDSGNWFVQTNYADGGNDVPALYSNPGYPSQTGNRITVGVGSDEAVFARRHFEGVTSGQIYMAGLMAYRYVGDYKWAGLSFYNGSSELAFVGKAGNAQVLAIDSYGDTKMESGHAMVGTEAWAGGSTGNVYLVIARYDFGSKQIQARVYNRNVAVPAVEPGSWEVSATAPGGGFGRVDGVRIAGGAYSANAIGALWFDEIRVATNWIGLFGREPTQPVPTNFVVNGGSPVTDEQVANGNFSVAMHLYDEYGVDSTGTPPLFQPNFDLFNTSDQQIIGDEVFNSFTYASAGRLLMASDTSHGTVASHLIGLGTYTGRISAVNSNGLTTIDRTTLSNGVAMTFTVVDDDVAGPVASSFNISGQTYGLDALAGSGLLATGLVQDAGSGVYGGSSNTYELYLGGSLVDSGAFTATPSDGGGKASAAAMSVTMPGSAFGAVGSYGLVVRTWDYDVDRAGDSTAGSNSFYFTVVAGSCPAGFAPTLTQPGNKYITEGNLLSFTVTISDSAGCPAPSLTASDLPSGASFNSSTSGSSRTGTFTWTPGGTQSGTYPVRFSGTDGGDLPLSTSLIIRVYVADAGEPTNSTGIPVSQTNWHVAITNIQVPSSGNITVVYSSVNGVAYDVYRSDNNYGGAMTWAKVVTEDVAAGSTDSAVLDSSVSQRYFQVVLAGGAPSSNGVWAVIRPTINAASVTLVSPGTAGDRKFNGELGTNLAKVLYGDETGPNDPSGDEVLILNANQSWRTLWLNSAGVWMEGGSPSTYELATGQGFYVLRNTGSSAQPRLTGPVGNTGIATNTLADNSGNGGWNIVTFSQGKHLSLATAFGNPAQGSPEGNWDETQADLIVMQTGATSWKRIMRTGDNTWLDLSTFSTANITFGPGAAVFYYRQPVGDMKLRF